MSADQKKTISTLDKADRAISGIIAPFLFGSVLTLTGISKFEGEFLNHQAFIGITATTASITGITCFVVFCLKVWQMIKHCRQQEKNTRKTFELGFSMLGMAIATAGAVCFAARMDQKVDYLKFADFSAWHLPPDWVPPTMFLGAILFISLGILIKSNNKAADIPKANKSNTSRLPKDLNYKEAIIFGMQIPGILMLSVESGMNINTRAFKDAAIVLLFIAAAGAFYLSFKEGYSAYQESTEREAVLSQSQIMN